MNLNRDVEHDQSESTVPGLSKRQMSYFLDVSESSFRKMAMTCDPLGTPVRREFYPRDLLAFMMIKLLEKEVDASELKTNGVCKTIFECCWKADDDYLNLYPLVVGLEPIAARIVIFHEHKRPREQYHQYSFGLLIDEMKTKLCAFDERKG